jgi:hypothetical protein
MGLNPRFLTANQVADVVVTRIRNHGSSDEKGVNQID